MYGAYHQLHHSAFVEGRAGDTLQEIDMVPYRQPFAFDNTFYAWLRGQSRSPFRPFIVPQENPATVTPISRPNPTALG